MSSTKQLGNEDLNAINNHNDSGVNTISESKGKPMAHHRHLRKPTQSVSKPSKVDEDRDDQSASTSSHDPLGMEEKNNDTNNCAFSTKNGEDETDDKHSKGRKIGKGRNADKPNNKCNNNNRRNRKNNENGRHSRKPSQKSSSNTHQQANP